MTSPHRSPSSARVASWRLRCHAVALALVVAGGLAAPGRAAAQQVPEADSLRVAVMLLAAQHRLVASLATGDSAVGRAFWCADYRTVGDRGVVMRDSVLRQYGPGAPDRSRLVRRFAPEDSGHALALVHGDTAATVSDTYSQDFVWRGAAWRERLVITHEFRRRPEGWCASRGRTTRLALVRRVP